MKPSRLLLGGLLAATLVATLLLPAGPAGAAEPDLSDVVEQVEPALANPPDLTGRTAVEPVVFHADGPTPAGVAPTATVTCFYDVVDPHVALQPTEVQATMRVACSHRLPAIVVSVSLYRQGSNSSLSSSLATAFATSSAEVHTFTPCKTSGYVALGTVTAFAPPGFSPPVRSRTAVSNVVLLAATDTGLPPFTCQRPPQPPPAPPTNPPTPGPVPVIHSLHCEYLGASQFDCFLNASQWTQIRWTYNDRPRPAWNNLINLPFPNPTCGGGIPKITVYVSNQFGAATRFDTFRCEGQPL